jgi:cytochrome c-type biogenesis protein CcmH/NrfF
MRRHEVNVTSLLIGLLFAGLGAYALIVGPDRLQDALQWVWPITLLGLGGAMLAGSSAREHRARHEISTERSEDGEVEQAGRSHDG